MIVLWSHIVYLVISIVVTVVVGQTLYRNGRVFLVDAFLGNEPLADSVNRLLLAGYYLLNVGFVSSALRFGARPDTAETAVEIVSAKLGLVLIVLGTIHLCNVYAFSRFRRAGMRNQAVPYGAGESDHTVRA
jgi:hypothetical protein